MFLVVIVTECKRRRLSVVNNVGNDGFTLDVTCAQRGRGVAVSCSL